MRAQNFNYLRKISIDPWREIERPAMKRGWKAEIQTARRRGARDKAGGRVREQGKGGRAVKTFIRRYQFFSKRPR